MAKQSENNRITHAQKTNIEKHSVNKTNTEKYSAKNEVENRGQALEENTSAKKEPIHWFHINQKYMSICRYALLVIICSIIIYLLISHLGETVNFASNLLKILSPFLMGVLVAYFLIPLVDKIQGLMWKVAKNKRYHKFTKPLAILVAYVIVIGFIAIAFIFIIPQMGQSIQELTEKIPFMYRQIMNVLTDLQERFPELDVEAVNKQFEQWVPGLVSYGTDLMGNLIPVVYSLSVSIVKTAVNLILGMIISIYMIYSKEKFRFQAKRVVYAFFPEEKGDMLCNTLRECNNIFGAFLISKAIDSLIIGCICCVAMNLFRLPYAVLLSVIVGITNMIPYFGPFIGAVPGVLIYLCTDWELAIGFAILILVLQQFDGLILGPRLLGQSTGLSPIWVIFAITVGGAYFGVLGMFIGVPVVAVIAYLVNILISSRLQGRNIKALDECQKK